MNKETGKKAATAVIDRVNDFRKQHTKAFVAIVIALALVLLGGCSSAVAGGSDVRSNQAASQKATAVLSFTVKADQWSTAEDGDVVVLFERQDNSQTPISKKYTAVPGQKFDTKLEPGTYKVSLADNKASNSDHCFTAEPVTIVFDGSKDCNVDLRIKLDAELTKKAEEATAAKKAEEEAAKKAEEEEKAKKEAEEKAKAEKEKAEAEAKAKAEAAAKAKASESKKSTQSSTAQKAPATNEATVYIASSGKGKKYHSRSTCSNMKGATSLSISAAESRGYTACKKCC